jgi:hypothetical protein
MAQDLEGHGDLLACVDGVAEHLRYVEPSCKLMFV